MGSNLPFGQKFLTLPINVCFLVKNGSCLKGEIETKEDMQRS